MPETAAESRNIRFMTCNIQHGMGMDGAMDIQRTAAVIAGAGPDIVFLQEVDRFVSRSGGVDQMMRLAELTGLSHVQFGRSIDLEGGEYGNGILSRYPLQRLALLELLNDWRTAPGGMEIPTYPPSPKPVCQLDYLFLNQSARWERHPCRLGRRGRLPTICPSLWTLFFIPDPPENRKHPPG
ncbi:endonuclease/exonuclease/phosphatase family protein [Paenibacillus sp. D51F]